MNAHWERRKFIKSLAAAGMGASLAPAAHAFNITSGYPVKDKYKVAVMGLNNRGRDHIRAFIAQSRAEIAFLCDVDSNVINAATEIVAKAGQTSKPKTVTDFRRALDDKSLDILSIAAPDHWHTPAALLGLKAGKHIYIEKPGSHNPAEAEMLLTATEKYGRVVQLGNQRRSWSRIIEAMKALHAGAIGRVYYARTWYTNTRPSIGRGRQVPVPANLDFDLWQGPAPRKPYLDNLVHYNWHWRWHWGTGEMLNNGTHYMDVARWGLQVNYPVKVFSTGGRYQFTDDWETPDTQIATFDFDDRKTIVWESRSCNQRGINDMGSGISFHGEQGTMEIRDNSYRIFDNQGNIVKSADPATEVVITQTGPGFDLDRDHFANFLDSIDSGKKPNSWYNECHASIMLCHLANISYRTGRALECDTRTGHIKNDGEAVKLWSREYENGWQPTLT